jgi:hypothetical protein
MGCTLLVNQLSVQGMRTLVYKLGWCRQGPPWFRQGLFFQRSIDPTLDVRLLAACVVMQLLTGPTVLPVTINMITNQPLTVKPHPASLAVPAVLIRPSYTLACVHKRHMTCDG